MRLEAEPPGVLGRSHVPQLGPGLGSGQLEPNDGGERAYRSVRYQC
jgi:hypothetical protein